MRIDDVNKGISRRKRRMRIGRGNGSGKGKTSGRGQDGQKSRRGFSRHPGKFGEDLPMVRRLPKRGFFNRYAATVIAINVGDLSQVYPAGEEVSPESLQAKGIVKKRFDEIKILGDGEIDKALNVSAHRFSKSAEEKIAAAGGKVEKLQAKRTPAERVAALAKK